MNKSNKVRVIEVVPYQSKWKEDFKKEADSIKQILEEEIVELHHIGSTSIPNMFAKPIIDILISVRDITAIDSYNDKLNQLGYIAKGEFGIEGRRFFLKGLYDRTHHIHIFQQGNPEIIRHINFRDYMMAHPNEAKEYEELKKKLAIQFRYDIEGYCNGKDKFIKNIDEKAKEWAKSDNYTNI